MSAAGSEALPLQPGAVSLLAYTYSDQDRRMQATQGGLDLLDQMGFYIPDERQLTEANGSGGFEYYVGEVDEVVIINNSKGRELPRHSLLLIEKARQLGKLSWLWEKPAEEGLAVGRAMQFGAKILDFSTVGFQAVRERILAAEAERRRSK